MKLTKHQRGSALMIALFVIVIVMLLASSLLKLLSSSNEAVSQEVLGTRALAAANSGMQAHLQKLFPLAPSAPSCVASFNYSFVSVQGLNSCSAVATCNNFANHNGVSYYRLESTGTCGTGTMEDDSNAIVLSSRTVQVEARTL